MKKSKGGPDMGNVKDLVCAYYAHMQNGDSEGMRICADAIIDALFTDELVGYENWILKCPDCEKTTPYGSYWAFIGAQKGRIVVVGECDHSWDANSGEIIK